MADLLLELFSEEIPARMQQRAADDLLRLVTDGLGARGLSHEEAEGFATPRRLALHVSGIPERAADISEERKGPRVGAPVQAVQGFLRGAGLAGIGEAKIVKDDKKGDFYVAVIEKKGAPAAEIIAEAVAEAIGKFPWPKSMRWGRGALRWVRPLQSILCLLDGKPVTFEIDGVASGDTTFGHRFMAPKAIKVSGFADYQAKLKKAFVILDAGARAAEILAGAEKLAAKAGLELVRDEALLAENAGLVEWPVPLMGSFDEAFLAIPPEVIRTTIRANQKCFVLRDAKADKLANRFILMSNLVAKDGGKAIIAGNERVIAARLSDAKFFWEQDLAVKLEDRVEKLKQITFHERLGTQFERVERIKHLAREIAPITGADEDKAERAAQLCKADLLTEMVGEFPELQGLMGRYYAQMQGEDVHVAAACEEHYRPQGPGDTVPSDPVSIAVALADKLDMLVGFWSVNEKPTGSKDPFALRRAALGVIRIVVEKGLRLPLLSVASEHALWVPPNRNAYVTQDYHGQKVVPEAVDLLSFFHDRLKVHLRDSGARHDLIDAVISPEDDDLLMIVRRVEALGEFLDTDDGANLLTGVDRATSILRIEEKKDSRAYDGAPDRALLSQPEERELANVLDSVAHHVDDHVAREDFVGAMRAIARLRPAVDAFFDHVTVNTEDKALRENRLKLLNAIRETTLKVADFSRIAG